MVGGRDVAFHGLLCAVLPLVWLTPICLRERCRTAPAALEVAAHVGYGGTGLIGMREVLVAEWVGLGSASFM